ncbi:UDP-N-acetylmuramoyl-L-alanine--D-glutamate ligase [Devosia rhodophyticola]|uniref:UDP-N-acetylmuramoylalanine--D-glutamate ligase n=1 Tax=Devosia rhodophyticola TaxID=3026423 RepID=A0ABY7YVS9_9HYPH|nr:UDP-N-acetylmuramoyl-L-alanine--D-glutamate ligase [Devosia rhodophyticola]WDR05049.1 UDP-N-acetylmuramoyl-L-alanine--D-glutamate ligase [Devosia rhodophyticola]
MLFEAPVLLYGAGREAISTRAFLARQQPKLRVYVTADSGETNISDAAFIAPDEIERAITDRKFAHIIKSPGVSRYKPIFALAERAGIAVTSNLNLWGATFRQSRTVIAITGTKGKSTTATLVHLMLTASEIDAGLGGNVGVAPLELADKYPTVVLELSSYQTADMDFLPDIAAITNLYPEHVDWHGSVAQYYEDKLHLISREGPVRIALGTAAQTNSLVLSALGGEDRLLSRPSEMQRLAINRAIDSSRLRGNHNRDNALLAAQIALGTGATIEGVIAGIAAFAPLPHRLEEHQIGELIFVNDSISTTPEATKAALAAYPDRHIALIAGGHEREQDYNELADLLESRGVAILICLPVTGERLAATAENCTSSIEVLRAPDLEAAMRALVERQNFDTVILSPGAPSYNQFKNFEERGHHFVSLAQQLFSNRNTG